MKRKEDKTFMMILNWKKSILFILKYFTAVMVEVDGRAANVDDWIEGCGVTHHSHVNNAGACQPLILYYDSWREVTNLGPQGF